MYYNLSKDAVFFIGASQETSPVQGKKTLFVVGPRSIPLTIELANLHGCKHIHLGAQRSFQRNKIWDNYIRSLINEKFTVTLEYPVDANDFVESSISSELLRSKSFYALITVPINYAEGLNTNACIKITDTHQSNSGVWTLPLTEVLHSNRFTNTDQLEFEIVQTDADLKRK
jgi:hypothetical protein